MSRGTRRDVAYRLLLTSALALLAALIFAAVRGHPVPDAPATPTPSSPPSLSVVR